MQRVDKRPASIVAAIYFEVAPAAFASSASAAVYNAIITKSSNSINGSAQLDLSLESTNGGSTPIDVTVFRADGTRDDFQIVTNANGFATTASTKDLFVAGGGQDALVQARTPSGVESSTAILRQKVGGEKIILGVPAATRAGEPLGVHTQFAVALGDVSRTATLLIANVTDGLPAEVRVHPGSVALPARYFNPELGVHKIWKVPLSAADARTHIVVHSSVPIIVQFVSDDGKVDEATIVAL
jgi:hypothetical protein